jgi:hypothetical protein
MYHANGVILVAVTHDLHLFKGDQPAIHHWINVIILSDQEHRKLLERTIDSNRKYAGSN